MQRIKILWMEVAFHACYIFLAIYALFRVYSLGPNPYEQGIMYTAAIAAREGLEPNRDFFMQYGPVSSWLQGYWMRLFGPELIQLQLSTMFAVLLLSSVTFFTLRIFLGNTLRNILERALVNVWPSWGSMVVTLVESVRNLWWLCNLLLQNQLQGF